MRIRSLIIVLLLISAFSGPRLHAQLAAPGPSGVVMGHLHFTVKDIEASRKFWAALGGVPVQNGALQLIQFPGTFVMLRQAEPSGGTAGSVVPDVTFSVKDLRTSTAQFQTQGIRVEAGGIINGPDGVTVRLFEKPSIATPVAFDSIALQTMSPSETQAWYVKTFGATIGTLEKTRIEPGGRTRVELFAAMLPGVTLTFAKADAAPATTKGRALDHIGFEVKGLEAFCKRLEAAGTKFDRPYRALPNSTTAIAFLTDPWGTYIELTENLAPAK
jgi:catechol 2,3-dioxygenase-like lactoylglutathione lyase family enzyme